MGDYEDGPFFQYPRCANVQIYEYVPYRKEVVRYLDLIDTTYVGRAVFNFIARRRKTASIIPFTPTGGQLDAPTHPQSADRKDPASSVEALRCDGQRRSGYGRWDQHNRAGDGCRPEFRRSIRANHIDWSGEASNSAEIYNFYEAEFRTWFAL